MKTNYKFLVLFSLTTLILSCKKNESPSPVTNVNLDSKKSGISAKVNNSYFSSNASPNTIDGTDTIRIDNNQTAPYYATYGRDSSSLIILGNGEINDQDSVKWAQILLWVTNFKGEDIYPIEDGSSIAVFSAIDTSNNLRQFISSNSPNGRVIINRFDTLNNTISGTFEFAAQSNDSMLIIKNGVFNSVKIN